jgi:prepilin-type N-terminal cleavage/methylation domain-containing protein
MRKQSGFSILELLSVATIIAVVSAAAAPSMLRAVRSYRLKSAAQQIEDAFQSARFAAIQANGVRKVFVNSSNRTVSVGATTAAAAVPLPVGISFTAISVAAPSVVSTAAANATTIGGQQHATSTASISLPATSGATGYNEASFNSRGLPGPGINPGTVHWVYLTNTDGDLMAVTLTSAGSSQVWSRINGSWVKL